MGDGNQPESSGEDPFAELARAWTIFREGGVVPCPRDGAAVALAVDAGASVYRFVCTRCGTPSPWFEHGQHGLIVRHTVSSLFPFRDM